MYALGLVRVAEHGGGQRLAGAHLLYEPLERVRYAVVLGRADALGQLGPLAVDVVGQEQPAARVGRQEQLAKQPCGVRQLIGPAGQETPFREGGVKAHGLHLAHAQAHRDGGRAVHLLEPAHDAGHVRMPHRTAAQHGGYERVQICVLVVELGEQGYTQRGGFELVGLQRAQEHAGHYFLAPVVHLFRLSICAGQSILMQLIIIADTSCFSYS